jgi:hypothetical protein
MSWLGLIELRVLDWARRDLASARRLSDFRRPLPRSHKRGPVRPLLLTRTRMLERFRAKWNATRVRATKTRHGKKTSGGCRAGSAPHENRADDAGAVRAEVRATARCSVPKTLGPACSDKARDIAGILSSFRSVSSAPRPCHGDHVARTNALCLFTKHAHAMAWTLPPSSP